MRRWQRVIWGVLTLLLGITTSLTTDSNHDPTDLTRQNPTLPDLTADINQLSPRPSVRQIHLINRKTRPNPPPTYMQDATTNKNTAEKTRHVFELNSNQPRRHLSTGHIFHVNPATDGMDVRLTTKDDLKNTEVKQNMRKPLKLHPRFRQLNLASSVLKLHPVKPVGVGFKSRDRLPVYTRSLTKKNRDKRDARTDVKPDVHSPAKRDSTGNRLELLRAHNLSDNSTQNVKSPRVNLDMGSNVNKRQETIHFNTDDQKTMVNSFVERTNKLNPTKIKDGFLRTLNLTDSSSRNVKSAGLNFDRDSNVNKRQSTADSNMDYQKTEVNPLTQRTNSLNSTKIKNDFLRTLNLSDSSSRNVKSAKLNFDVDSTVNKRQNTTDSSTEYQKTMVNPFAQSTNGLNPTKTRDDFPDFHKIFGKYINRKRKDEVHFNSGYNWTEVLSFPQRTKEINPTRTARTGSEFSDTLSELIHKNSTKTLTNEKTSDLLPESAVDKLNRSVTNKKTGELHFNTDYHKIKIQSSTKKPSKINPQENGPELLDKPIYNYDKRNKNMDKEKRDKLLLDANYNGTELQELIRQNTDSDPTKTEANSLKTTAVPLDIHLLHPLDEYGSKNMGHKKRDNLPISTQYNQIVLQRKTRQIPTVNLPIIPLDPTKIDPVSLDEFTITNKNTDRKRKNELHLSINHQTRFQPHSGQITKLNLATTEPDLSKIKPVSLGIPLLNRASEKATNKNMDIEKKNELLRLEKNHELNLTTEPDPSKIKLISLDILPPDRNGTASEKSATKGGESASDNQLNNNNNISDSFINTQTLSTDNSSNTGQADSVFTESNESLHLTYTDPLLKWTNTAINANNTQLNSEEMNMTDISTVKESFFKHETENYASPDSLTATLLGEQLPALNFYAEKHKSEDVHITDNNTEDIVTNVDGFHPLPRENAAEFHLDTIKYENSNLTFEAAINADTSQSNATNMHSNKHKKNTGESAINLHDSNVNYSRSNLLLNLKISPNDEYNTNFQASTNYTKASTNMLANIYKTQHVNIFSENNATNSEVSSQVYKKYNQEANQKTPTYENRNPIFGDKTYHDRSSFSTNKQRVENSHIKTETNVDEITNFDPFKNVQSFNKNERQSEISHIITVTNESEATNLGPFSNVQTRNESKLYINPSDLQQENISPAKSGNTDKTSQVIQHNNTSNLNQSDGTDTVEFTQHLTKDLPNNYQELVQHEKSGLDFKTAAENKNESKFDSNNAPVTNATGSEQFQSGNARNYSWKTVKYEDSNLTIGTTATYDSESREVEQRLSLDSVFLGDNTDMVEMNDFDALEAREVEEAADYGLRMMNELIRVKEPELYRMGLWLERDNPAGKVAAFNAPNPQAITLSRYGYASLLASTRLMKQLSSSQGSTLEPRTGPVRLPPELRDTLRGTALHSECPLLNAPVACRPAARRYRTADGTCNNLEKPRRGAALTPHQRFLAPSYHDGLQTVRRSVINNLSLPSPRAISTRIHLSRHAESPSVTLMLMQWGQLIDHDVTSTPQSRAFNGSTPRCCADGGFQPPHLIHPECLPIEVPRDDWFLERFGVRCMEFVRSVPAPREDCEFGFRQQINQVTSYIDASTIYGSSPLQASTIRLFRSGLIQSSPPDSPNNGENCRSGAVSTQCLRPGDNRAAEQPALTALHIVWVRQHNLLAAELARVNTQWSDEKIYQEARRIVAAMIQHITYREFLPIVLGHEVLKLFDLELVKKGYYTGYDPKVNPSLANSFVAAAYRFGHSLVQHSFIRSDRFHRPMFNNVSMRDEQSNVENIWSSGSVDRLLLGLSNQPSQRRDEFISDELTNHLFQSPGFPFGMDLAAINVQRGRDHGLPSYTAWRQPCGLSPIKNWTDLQRVMSKETVERFRSIYLHVDDLDLFSAGLAERPVRGGFVGPTFACIIAQQFSNLRKGDRFWYENGNFESSFTPAQLQQIRKTTMAQIVCQTMTEVETIQPFVFLTPDNLRNRRTVCRDFTGFDLKPWDEQNSDQTNEPNRQEFLTDNNVESKTEISPILNSNSTIRRRGTLTPSSHLFDKTQTSVLFHNLNDDGQIPDKLHFKSPRSTAEAPLDLPDSNHTDQLKLLDTKTVDTRKVQGLNRTKREISVPETENNDAPDSTNIDVMISDLADLPFDSDSLRRSKDYKPEEREYIQHDDEFRRRESFDSDSLRSSKDYKPEARQNIKHDDEFRHRELDDLTMDTELDITDFNQTEDLEDQIDLARIERKRKQTNRRKTKPKLPTKNSTHPVITNLSTVGISTPRPIKQVPYFETNKISVNSGNYRPTYPAQNPYYQDYSANTRPVSSNPNNDEIIIHPTRRPTDSLMTYLVNSVQKTTTSTTPTPDYQFHIQINYFYNTTTEKNQLDLSRPNHQFDYRHNQKYDYRFPDRRPSNPNFSKPNTYNSYQYEPNGHSYSGSSYPNRYTSDKIDFGPTTRRPTVVTSDPITVIAIKPQLVSKPPTSNRPNVYVVNDYDTQRPSIYGSYSNEPSRPLYDYRPQYSAKPDTIVYKRPITGYVTNVDSKPIVIYGNNHQNSDYSNRRPTTNRRPDLTFIDLDDKLDFSSTTNNKKYVKISSTKKDVYSLPPEPLNDDKKYNKESNDEDLEMTYDDILEVYVKPDPDFVHFDSDPNTNRTDDSHTEPSSTDQETKILPNLNDDTQLCSTELPKPMNLFFDEDLLEL